MLRDNKSGDAQRKNRPLPIGFEKGEAKKSPDKMKKPGLPKEDGRQKDPEFARRNSRNSFLE